jgi:thymidylate kinase
LHDLKNAEMHPRTETLLYQAARAQIVEQVIKPRLDAGEIVISDRYLIQRLPIKATDISRIWNKSGLW